MTKYLTLAFLCCVSALSAQPEQDTVIEWLLQNRLPAYDLTGWPLPNHTLQFANIDSVINDQMTRPRYQDNWYEGLVMGAVVVTKRRYEWSEHADYWQLNEIRYLDDSGYRVIPTLLISKTDTAGCLNKVFPNELTGVWQVDWLGHQDSSFLPDSCHSLYRLALLTDMRYRQWYEGSDSRVCASAYMRPNLYLGIEDDDFWDKENWLDVVQRHEILNYSGYWWVEKGWLMCSDTARGRVNRYKIVSLTDTVLTLSRPERSDRLILRKKI